MTKRRHWLISVLRLGAICVATACATTGSARQRSPDRSSSSSQTVRTSPPSVKERKPPKQAMPQDQEPAVDETEPPPEQPRAQDAGPPLLGESTSQPSANETTPDDGEPTAPMQGVISSENGFATWYGDDWHGKPTASGKPFDKNKFTAAHRTLPLGTIVRVTNQRNRKSVVLKITDRGPYGRRRERIIDVSWVAAKKLDFVVAGVCPVKVEVLTLPPPKAKKRKSRR